jgi:hypothetical protein
MLLLIQLEESKTMTNFKKYKKKKKKTSKFQG